MTEIADPSEPSAVIENPAPPILAAGVLFIARGKVLLVQRAPGSDAGGMWAFPGGKVEAGETLEEAARRECVEEIGIMPSGKMSPFDFSDNGLVAFTTFVQSCEQFNPVLNNEHTGFVWAPLDQYPEPLHPGAATTLAKLTMTELDVARGIRDGLLPSPSRFQNVTMFDMRITGTGTSYRDKDKQFVYRAPANYLSEEFLARCNGLTVIWEHPKKRKLDSDEFGSRVVGSIMLPYIKGDEVWGVAKIYDDDAIEMLSKEQLSTSPTVVFSHPAVNTVVSVDDENTVLIEGNPALLCHLAICEGGVWDKGGAPSGVISVTATPIDQEVIDMTEEERAAADAAAKAKADADTEKMEAEKADKAKADATAKAKADAEDEDWRATMMDSLKKIVTRMDSIEAKTKTAKADVEGDDEEKKKADAAAKAKADADEAEAKKKEEEKADSLALRSRLAALEAAVNPNDADRTKFAAAQARADEVAQAFADSAPRPLAGETLLGYRRRLVGSFKKHSAAYKELDMSIVPEAMIAAVENTVYADALSVARNPASVTHGELRKVTKRGFTGHEITEWVGHPDAAFAPFKMHLQVARLKMPASAGR